MSGAVMRGPEHSGLAPLSIAALSGWTTLDAALGAGVALAFTLLLGVGLAIGKASGLDFGPPEASLGGMPAVFIPLSLLGTVGAGLVLWLLHRRRLPALPLPRAWRSHLALEVAGFAFGIQLAAMAFTALTAALGVTTSGRNVELVLAAYSAAPVLTVLGVVLLAPIGEELVFRRILLHRFALAGRPLLGLCATSILFALIHEPWPGDTGVLAWVLTLSTYLVISLGFGLMYLRSGRLDVVILAHVLVNASGILFLVWSSP